MQKLYRIIEQFPAAREKEVIEKFSRVITDLSHDDNKAISQLHQAYLSEATDLVRKNTNITLIGHYNQSRQEPHRDRNCDCLIF